MTCEEWAEAVETFVARWPRWKPNRTILEDWRAALGGQSLATVEAAGRRVGREYSSPQPSLKWMVKATAAIETERRRERTPEPTPLDGAQQADDERARVTALLAAVPPAALAATAVQVRESVLGPAPAEPRRYTDGPWAGWTFRERIASLDPADWPIDFARYVAFASRSA